jgi:hypothetical protein
MTEPHGCAEGPQRSRCLGFLLRTSQCCFYGRDSGVHGGTGTTTAFEVLRLPYKIVEAHRIRIVSVALRGLVWHSG